MWISSSTSRLKQLLPDETWRDCSVYLVTQAAIMSHSLENRIEDMKQMPRKVLMKLIKDPNQPYTTQISKP